MDSLSPVSEVHNILGNRGLPSSSGKRPRAAAIAYIVWGICWTPLINTFEKDFSYLVLSFWSCFVVVDLFCYFFFLDSVAVYSSEFNVSSSHIMLREALY